MRSERAAPSFHAWHLRRKAGYALHHQWNQVTTLFVARLDSKVNHTTTSIARTDVDGIHPVFCHKQHDITAANELLGDYNRHEWTTGFYICALNNACGLIQCVDACALVKKTTELLADIV